LSVYLFLLFDSGIRHYWKKGEPITDDELLLPEYYLTRSYSSVDEALLLFLHDELLHRPGTAWLYTTHGYTLLSAILESQSNEKRTFAELLQDLVQKQFNLKHTKLEYPDELVQNRSRYYCRQRTGKRDLRNVAYVDLSYKWAGGGMLSNVTDLLIFANTLLQCRQTCSFDCSTNKPVLSADRLSEMWSPIVATNRKHVYYGLGWMVANEQTSAINQCTIPAHVFHTGGAVGATSILLIIPCSNKCVNPRCGVCIAILTNLHSAEDIYQTAVDIALVFRQISPCSMQK
jgi:serine beta-lactamase-like protein LACTB, mitochondrial